MIDVPAILAKAKEYETYTAENLSRLVQCKSLSGSEKTAAEEMKRQLVRAGFDDVRIDGIGNVIGRIGSGSKVLAIDGHIDTVDLGEEENWDFSPLEGKIRNNFVEGRGTVDQKGGLASAVTAGRIVKELGLDNDLTLFVTATVMEEDCDGLCWKYLIEEEKIKPDAVIITEPTNCNIYRGHRGRMEIELRFRGISSHGSAPERGKNAVYMAARAALAIEKLHPELRSDDFLGKGSVAVTEFVSDSPSLCAVADYAKLHLDRRLTWNEDEDSALREIEKALEGEEFEISVPEYKGVAYTGKEYGMKKYFPTWKLEENHPVIESGAKVYEELFSQKPLIDKWTFSTNGVTINGLFTIPIIGFGPGNEVLAHAPNEKVPVGQLTTAAAFYAAYALQF